MYLFIISTGKRKKCFNQDIENKNRRKWISCHMPVIGLKDAYGLPFISH